MHHYNKDNNNQLPYEYYKFKEYLWLATASENFKRPKIFQLMHVRNFDRGFPRFGSNSQNWHDITKQVEKLKETF